MTRALLVSLLALLAISPLARGDVERREVKPKQDGPWSGNPILRQGERGDAVRILQHLLNDALRAQGKTKGIALDGVFGKRTTRAIGRIQKDCGLRPTGRLGKKTWDAIRQLVCWGRLGKINPFGGETAKDRYARKGKLETDVSLHLLPAIEVAQGKKGKPAKKAQPILFESKMAIDADGDGDAWKSDPWGQPHTSLRDRKTKKSVNPTKIPYFVLPIGFDKKHPPIRLGDIAAVIYKSKVAYAIYADRGPRGRIGEGSIKLAKDLGINASPTKGGVSAGVFYVVFPGSGTGQPLTRAEIRRRGRALFVKAGGNPPGKKRKKKR